MGMNHRMEIGSCAQKITMKAPLGRGFQRSLPMAIVAVQLHPCQHLRFESACRYARGGDQHRPPDPSREIAGRSSVQPAGIQFLGAGHQIGA